MRTENQYLGLDCLALPASFSGAGNYMYYLTRALLQLARDLPIAVFCKPENRKIFKPFLSDKDKLVVVPLKNRFQRLYYTELFLKKLLLKENVALFHATHYICPPQNKAYGISNTFHDMGFFLHPNYYPFVKRLYFRNRVPRFFKRSDRIVAISHSTRKTIENVFPGHRSKISVIYPGADHFNSREFYFRANGHPEKPFFLAVNSFETRKNIPFIIQLFNHLKREYQLKHKLIIAGHPANASGKILLEKNKSRYREDIHILTAIPMEELVYYYKNAELFLNASIFEGFGFTPFEAINFGLPAFLFKNSVVAEIIGEHPYLFADFNIRKWAGQIIQEMENGYKNKIPSSLIADLTWRRSAEQFLVIFHNMFFSREVQFAI